nr:WAS/WASL-interacting protein family member 1-like isoform X2 [Aegilops tauschii subsp. strangulata]
MPNHCPPLMLDRELARELEKPPRGYISVPRALPQLIHPSLASFALWNRQISLFFAVLVSAIAGVRSSPVCLALPSPFQLVPRFPLTPVAHPNHFTIAGEHRGRVPRARPPPPPFGLHPVRPVQALPLPPDSTTASPTSRGTTPRPHTSLECPGLRQPPPPASLCAPRVAAVRRLPAPPQRLLAVGTGARVPCDPAGVLVRAGAGLSRPPRRRQRGPSPASSVLHGGAAGGRRRAWLGPSTARGTPSSATLKPAPPLPRYFAGHAGFDCLLVVVSVRAS